MPELSLKLAYYEAKIKAIEDCLTILKTDENTNFSESIKNFRKLSKKQFNTLIKKRKLIAHLSFQGNMQNRYY